MEIGHAISIKFLKVKTHSNSTIEQNIGSIYGSAVQKELISFEVNESDGPLQFKASGQVNKLDINEH